MAVRFAREHDLLLSVADLGLLHLEGALNERGEGEERIRATHGANFERPVGVKTRYDPDNVFRSNRNVPPRNTVPAAGGQGGPRTAVTG